MTTPQPIPVGQPTPPTPTPVGQPIAPVQFFRRMSGGGTQYVRLLAVADQTETAAPEITDAAVEAAAIAWTNRVPDTTPSDRWQALTETGRRMRRQHMRITLAAATPILTDPLVEEITRLRAERDALKATTEHLDVDQFPADRVEKLAQWLHGRNIGICEMDDDTVYNGIESMRELAQALLQHGPDGIRITAPEATAEAPKQADEDEIDRFDPDYCPDERAEDNHHSPEYFKRGFLCAWCHADPDAVLAETPAPTTEEGGDR